MIDCSRHGIGRPLSPPAARLECHACLRTGVTDLPGLNTRRAGGKPVTSEGDRGESHRLAHASGVTSVPALVASTVPGRPSPPLTGRVPEGRSVSLSCTTFVDTRRVTGQSLRSRELEANLEVSADRREPSMSGRITTYRGGRLSRRSMLRAAGMTGGGLAAAALIGCQGDDDPEEDGSTSTPGAASASPTGTGAAAGGGGETSGDIKRGGTYLTSTSGDAATLDPYGNASTGTKSFAAYVYSRLYRIGADPDVDPQEAPIVPDLAESAETDDGQHWTVTLKQGVPFQDIAPVSGRELTADDVLYSWERLRAPESPNSSQVENILNVAVVDDYTLTFDLAAPSPIFMSQISDGNLLWVMPRESGSDFDPAVTPIGSGPWRMAEYEISSNFQFERHENYFEDWPYMDAVSEFIIPEYANRYSQFQAGNLHAISVTSDDVPVLKTEQPDVQWVPIPGGSLDFMYFSPEESHPDAPWRDERFRRATSMALDRDGIMEFGYNLEAIAEVGLEYPVRWNNIIPAALGPRWWLDPQSEAHGPTGAYFQYNPEEAMKLIQAMDLPDTPITYQYTDNRYGPGFGNLAVVCYNWLVDIGLPVEAQTQDYNSQYITQTFRGDFEGIAFGVSSPFSDPSGYTARFFTDNPTNHGRVSDPVITDLHEKQSIELDEEARREIFFDIQRQNADQMWYVPVQPSGGAVWIGVRPNVRDFARTRSYGGGTEVVGKIWLDS
ncbi:MAG: hypothetical protein GEU80_17430 [Dehalococcoidia bacterium]|nr:hypothetical protein [Dehalococcoidia bacterium]